jgi:hypothetical protein
MAVGQQCGDQPIVDDGLSMLRWLRKQETSPLGHLSFTPVGGWTRGEPRPGFDQQPIEAWHYAEAGLRAYAHTGDETWKELVGQCVEWFDTRNDSGLRMWDETTGAAFDGLERHKPNLNQGAESTLALLGAIWSLRQTGAIAQHLRRQQPPIRSADFSAAPDQV